MVSKMAMCLEVIQDIQVGHPVLPSIVRAIRAGELLAHLGDPC